MKNQKFAWWMAVSVLSLWMVLLTVNTATQGDASAATMAGDTCTKPPPDDPPAE